MIPGTKDKQRLVLMKVSSILWRKVGHLVAFELHCLDYTIAQMHNRTPTSRGRRTSVPITPAVKAAIRNVYAIDPNANQHDVAYSVGTNQGRVNNVLRGIRK
jgi:hypothetical protein